MEFVDELGKAQPELILKFHCAGFENALWVLRLGLAGYFALTESILALHTSWTAVVLCALINGVLGGLFAKALLAGPASWLPARWRTPPIRRPIAVAASCGLLVALLGMAVGGSTYGTGYGQVAALLNGQPGPGSGFGLAKWAATVVSYFAGIPGGIFTPSLAIGAGIGNNIAQLLPGAVDPRRAQSVALAPRIGIHAGGAWLPTPACSADCAWQRGRELGRASSRERV